MLVTVNSHFYDAAERPVIQSLFDFSAYFKFFIGLFALVNPVGIIPVFISMTSYQTAAVRNKTNLTANLSVAIILLTSLFLGDAILQVFGISIDSFRIAGGILVVTIAMSMISGKLGEDKQNKQEKSETAIRESIGVVPLALPLMAGPGAITVSPTLLAFPSLSRFLRCAAGAFSVWPPGWFVYLVKPVST